MNHRRSVAPLLCCLVLASSPAHAADTPQTLAQALAHADAPKSDLYIAVDAEKIALANGARALADGLSAGQTAAAFGQKVGSFGSVEAIAPPTIVVVDVPPDTPDVYDGMEPGQIVKLLAATFSKEQWQAFLSEDGLAYAGLTSSDQQRMFEALFPDGKMSAVRFEPTGAGQTPTELSGNQLRTARLRLASITSIALAIPGKPDSHVFANSYSPPDSPGFYVMANSHSDNVDREFGAWVRETVPNTPKPSDLDGDDPAWKSLVPLAGARTVDDVSRAISAATRREVYADPRYGKKTVAMTGPDTPRRAYDLMRALALCVGGAWRKTGPALVLTNDRVGLAVKQELWKAFEAKAAALAPSGDRDAPVAQPDGAAFTVKDIRSTGDDFPLSDKQRDAFWKKFEANDPGSSSMSRSNAQHLNLPFGDLTPAQQDAARHIQEANAKDHTESTLDGDIMLQIEPMVEILLPSIPVPVFIPSAYEMLLPYPSITAAAAAAADQREAESQAAKAGPPLPDKPPTAAEMLAKIHTFARRAVLVETGSPEEVAQNIAAMKTLGLNELWLRVPLSADGKSDSAALDLLRHAATGAQAAHIALYPALRLLDWGEKAPIELMDCTLMGETNRTVTPFAPAAAKRMAALVDAAAQIPGVAGMLWSDSTPTGYTESRSPYGGAELGYAVPGRLASLRGSHTDPIDLVDYRFGFPRAHVSLPDFGVGSGNAELFDDWRELRVTTLRAFVAALAADLPASYAPGPHRTPILAPPTDGPGFQIFGSWDDLSQPPPSVKFVPILGADGKPRPDGAETQTMTSARYYNTVSLGAPDDQSPSDLLRETARLLQAWIDAKSPSIVFDTADAKILPRLADAIGAAK